MSVVCGLGMAFNLMKYFGIFGVFGDIFRYICEEPIGFMSIYIYLGVMNVCRDSFALRMFAVHGARQLLACVNMLCGRVQV